MSIPARHQWLAPSGDPVADAVPSRRRRGNPQRRRVLSALLACCVLLSVIATVLSVRALRKGATGTSLYHLPFPSRSITVTDIRSERHFGFVSVVGTAVNQTVRPLHTVEAVVELLDAGHRPLLSESAVLASGPLLPHVPVPFRVEMLDHPRATSYRVYFRNLMGPVLR
ncbi:MAG: hypothetical protein RMJ43_10255 [Chloroherpetonaceae bacterium]|nr:hypothetical protein [Chthonomonadaceae bacterium]MDW8208210.1 hypothetical protein [Chloroherpetonaceae bacterium]